MEFRILGPLEVVEQGRVLPLGGVEAADAARAPAHPCERGRLGGPADRRALGRRAAAGQPPTRCSTTSRSSARRSLRSEAIVTQEPGYVIRIGPDELDLLRFERAGARRRNTRRPSLRRSGCAKRSTSGAGRRSPTSPTSRSRRARSSPRGAPPRRRSSGGSKPTSRSAATPSSSPRCRCSSASIRSASGCGPRSCRRSTARVARPRRSRSIARRGGCSSTSSASSRARPCRSSSRRSFARTPP